MEEVTGHGLAVCGFSGCLGVVSASSIFSRVFIGIFSSTKAAQVAVGLLPPGRGQALGATPGNQPVLLPPPLEAPWWTQTTDQRLRVQQLHRLRSGKKDQRSGRCRPVQASLPGDFRVAEVLIQRSSSPLPGQLSRRLITGGTTDAAALPRQGCLDPLPGLALSRGMPCQQGWAAHGRLPQTVAQPVEHRMMRARFSVAE